MKKGIFILAGLFLLSFQGYGQSTGKNISSATEVIKVITQMFDGMRAGDSSLISEVFHPDITFASVFSDAEGVPQVRPGSGAAFLKAVGTPHEAQWDERISDLSVKIEDHLATAWMKYAFYLGGELHHCGVNAFTLVETSDGWKIFHIIDTRKTGDCAGYGE